MKKLLTLLLLLTVAAATARAQRSTATVSGYITDETSGETLLGAGVLLDNGSRTPTGAVTNVYGFYTLTLPKGKTGCSTATWVMRAGWWSWTSSGTRPSTSS